MPGGFQSKVVAPHNPKLVREAEECAPVSQLTPSAFLKEMSLTTKQRLDNTRATRQPRPIQLLDLSEASNHKFSAVDLDQSLFQSFPSEVVFQSYSPFEVYEVPLILRNKDKVPRLVKVVMESSPYFQLISPKDVCCKVAPGLTATFHILFKPAETKDYFHQITCITEREKFIVPIRAIGARAILDFPDELNFSVCPVKYSTQKTLFVRNIGHREARYRLSTQSPFSVDPSVGTLGIGDAMQVSVDFHPMKTGDHSGSLTVHYDTGEDIHTRLYGAAEDVNIRLDKRSLTVEKTYLTLSNRKSVVIHNRSEIIARFQWKAFVTQEEEDVHKLRLSRMLQRQQSKHMDSPLEEYLMGLSLVQRLSRLTRAFQNQRATVEGDSMLFCSDIFTIEPVEGEIWPNSSVEINVIFKPKEARVYQETVYCDISGRETRLPLRIKAEGVGPQLCLSFEQLDIGTAFVGAAHSYEVILFNKGVIDAQFNLVPPTTALGSCFTFLPKEGTILPDGLQVIQISFSSTILGQFTEEFKFNVVGSPKPVTLTFRGCVIGPTFHFDVPSLHFGDVSFGFPRTLSCRLTNTSLVRMTFNLRVPGDGSGGRRILSVAQISDSSGSSSGKGAQGPIKTSEFTITPCSGTIRALGVLDIQVTLCSNTLKTYEVALVVDVEGVGEEVLALLLTARCVVPQLRVLNPVMTFGQCFLEFPYQQMLTLVNDSDLPGCYRVLPQEQKKGAAVQYSSPTSWEIVEPRSLVQIPFTLKAQAVEEQDTVARIVVFGMEESPLIIHLVSVGQGPVVYVHPNQLNFGAIQVLQDASQTLHLSNQTVIPASFRAEMAGKSSRWRIEPSKGVIPPETEVSVTVIAHLDDNDNFKDKVKVFIENSHTCVVPVQAAGIGTTIVTDKPFAPETDLGPHFSLDPCYYHFKIMNKGRRTHKLYWSTDGFPPPHRRDCLYAPPKTKGKVSTQSPKSACPIFKLEPSKVELMPGKTVEMVLKGSSSTPQVVKERLLCQAIVENKSGMVQVMQVDVTCNFIAPRMQMSAREIAFRVEKRPSDVLTFEYKPLSLKNVSSLPLSVFLTLEEPFSVCDADQQPLSAEVQPVKLEIGEELHLSIRFNPAYEEDLNSRKVEKTLKIQFLEHPHKEQVTVRGEVYFPNLHIQTSAVDFGCILNDTEVERYIEMTNCSPLLVQYHWLFLIGSHFSEIRFSSSGPRYFTKPQALEEEGVRSERSVPAESSSRARGAEEPARALGAAGDPAQKPADADGSLEAQPLPSTAAELGGAMETQRPVMTKELLQMMEAEPFDVGMEEVFDILPTYAVLQPGQSEHVKLTFFGHANIVARVTALCKVEGGPSYEITLSGEASLIHYLLDTKEINCGLQLFNEVIEAEVTLQNSGKMGFTYVVLNPSMATADSPLPGVPLVLPSTGHVGPGKEQVLKVYYLPGVPGVFSSTFQIQVGHLEPEEISLKGEGCFPRIYLDLPRNIEGNEKYEKILKEIKEKMEKDNQRDEEVVLEEGVTTEPPTDESGTMLDTHLLMQMEQMLIEEHALEQQKALTSGPPEDAAFDQRARQRLVKAQLPEYVLDFGCVIPGNISTHIVKITNTGQLPASFRANGRVLCDTGFSTELDRVKHLPYCETETFEVRFDPQSANLPQGEVAVLLPIKVTGGPTFHIHLCANVILPSLCLSRDKLEFSTIQRGQCQEETIQFHNPLQVPCQWFVTVNERVKKVDKHGPANLSQNLFQKVKAKPCVFEMLPSAGTVAPGERCNVQVRFSPTEEKFYRSELKINICQSSQHLQLQVSGKGLEPQLEFSSTVLELGPLLPHSPGVEETVIVKNPCDYPIEFYSLEFDQQYLTEEEILRMMKDYDCHKTLLLPPRAPGEQLPPELLEYYQDQKRLQDKQAKSQTGEPAGQDNANSEDVQALSDQGRKRSAGIVPTISSRGSVPPFSVFNESQSSRVGSKSECGEEEQAEKGHGTAEHGQSTASSKEAAGEVDDSPVRRAIARHLGIDISPEGRAARNCRGIVVIVHGAPLTGKTSAAVALSKYYGAACLSIDTVVTEAIADRSSLAGVRARELCMKAAMERNHKDSEDAGQNADLSPLQFSTEASPDVTQPSSEDKDSQQSLSCRGRVTTTAGKKKTSGDSSQPQKQHQTDPMSSQASPPSPLPCAPAQQQLSISGSVAGEMGLMSCVLPEDLLVAILSERLQLSDCYQGVVFDGLETLFAHNMVSALLCLLKAVRNRPHIYFVNLFQDYTALKARETAAKEQEEREQEEAARREKERLWEVDEEEYEDLTDEQKTELNKHIRQVQQERKKRELERLARELEEKHQRELERLKEEEEMKKKCKRGKRELGRDTPLGRRGQLVRQETNTSTSHRSDVTEVTDRKGSVAGGKEDKKGTISHRSDVTEVTGLKGSVAGGEEDKKETKVPLPDASLTGVVQPLEQEQEETKDEALNESEKNLALRFKIYEVLQKDIAHILATWDRVHGVLPPTPQEELLPQAEQRQPSSGRRTRKEREKERQERLEKERLEKEQLEELKALESSRLCQLEGEGPEGSARGQDVAVPYLDIQVMESEDVIKDILESGKLPAAEQILDHLELGPSGPPVPPTAFYSVIHYPEKRMPPAAEALQHFVFVVPRGANVEEETKDMKTLVDAPAVPAVEASEEQVTLVGARLKKEKAPSGREAVRGKRSPSRGRKGLQRPGTGARTRTPSGDRSSVGKGPFPQRSVRLSKCRWVVPAHSEVELKVHFSSEVLGHFDQTLHFEILGTNRLYQLQCRGTCLYPTISQDPRLVFPHWRMSKEDDEIIFKQYVMKTGVFHFGPLLCGKSRDWYKARPSPSNCEKITILNTSPMEAEVHFSFEHDLKADTFLLDPPNMKLEPHEKQELSIWAYPTSAGLVEDKLICCIQDNPEPVVFQLCCQGVQVELGLSPKHIHFNKLLLHRRDSKTLVLQNSTPLPMAWRLSGLENLGEEFSVSQEEGIVCPHTKFDVQLSFKATKAVTIKKMIRLEVSDTENTLGIVQIENIQITAEAYDVALSINIAKGADGRVDFGTLKVLEDAKQMLTLKNKGKYEIAYSFKLESADKDIPDLASHFTVQPQKGTLAVSEHPVHVQLLFHPKMEINIENKAILQCQVIEPSVCEGGETVAVIPVRVSARAVFSKYSIDPASLINFGVMTNGTRKTCTFTLENEGFIDFQFLICRAGPDATGSRRKSVSPIKSARLHESETSNRVSPPVKQSKHSLQNDSDPLLQARITLGMFMVYPCVGSIPPGGQQVITVDCYAESLGTCKEHLMIDISDRDPKDNPLGIPYTLSAESCLPAFVVDDIESIFEEHRICSNMNLCQVLQTVEDKGVFITDENRFIFTDVLVGQRATARFKLCNVGKVPCNVVLSIKPISGKANTRIGDIFAVDPVRMCVPSHSHGFVTVTFTPRTMQNYRCTFEASLEHQASSAANKGQSLSFSISGDGNLPQVTILRPVLHNKRENPLLLFKKLLLGDSEKLPLVLQNDGTIPVQLMIDLVDEGGVFFLKARPTTQCMCQATDTEESPEEGRKPHTASLVLQHGELAEFDVLFKPTLAQRVEGKIHLSVVDNPFEETNIQLVGEGYEDDFTLDNIHGLVADSKEEDTIEAARVDHIQFGDCHIGTSYPVTFTITNRSRVDAMRFEWLADAPFHFSPQVGHLHAGCAKHVTVTLKSDVAVAFKMHPVKCKVARISFQLPPDEVPDWDDCLHTIQWVDDTSGPADTLPVKKKVIKTDPEPDHTVLEDSNREVDLLLSAVVDYAEFQLDTNMIEFKETLLFQTRTSTFQLSNPGKVALEYTWMAAAVEDESTVSCSEEQLPPSLEGNGLSSTSGASVKLQSSRCSSQLDHAQEHTSSSLSSSPNAIGATSAFSVEPKSGTIPAGQGQVFQMKFSPMYVGNFESCVLCSIPNLKPEQKGPEVTVKGRSQMPQCHFELEDSDYVTTKRCSPELQGAKGTALDLDTRVIEFAAIGVGDRKSRTIMVLNPTSSAYSFLWTCQDSEAPPEQVAFFCLTQRDEIQPGKKAEIKFDFIPQHLDFTVSSWDFTIPEQKVSVPFLLVGNATEPLVTLDRSHLNFQLLLIGQATHRTIYMINSEKEAFSFAFRESSLFSEGSNASVKVEPLEGSIAPLSRIPITVTFTPTLEGEVVFNLKCNVKRKTQPLSLNVKATGYSMNPSVKCEDSDGCVTELSAQETNVIDFKEVQLNENMKRIFSIHNNGKLSFTFSWELSGPAAQKQVLTISPQTGTVEAEGRVETQLAFHPQKMCSLKDVKLTLQINKGPKFTCVFLATVVVPTVHFSTTRLDFGSCFIHSAGMLPAHQTLVITNKADKEMSLSCLFTNTAHLEVNFPARVLQPGGAVEVPITFYPREVASYREIIPFEVNSLCQQTVEVQGRGIEMKVDVVDPRGKVVKLGALSIGQTVKKIITIANNSAAPVTFKLSLRSTIPELQEAGVLCLNPTNDLSLKPKGDTCKVEVTFSPKHRIQPFTGEVMLECGGLVRSLVMVQGSCWGIHVSLDQEHLSFGAVVQQSYRSRRIIMQNTGDIGVNFMWDTKSFKPDFSISPTKGYISPGKDVPLVVTFHPSTLSHAILYKDLQCFIQGSEPLRLTLAGYCMETPVTKETLTFTCNVREEQSQTILLSNPNNEPWTVKPVIEGEYWKGPEFFHLEANQQKPYKITYKPPTMTSEKKKHQGSIFFPLPDGTGLYYLLQGTAETPKCSGTILRQVPCRTSYTEVIPVTNWLNRPQRFHVVVDILKSENLESSSVVQGLEYIEVPSSDRKDYKLTFLSYKEGVFNAMVTFLNETTREYLFYMVTFKAIASGPISTVEITTAVRQSVSSSVKVDNPLPVPVTFAIECKVPDITIPPRFTVPAQSEADLVFEYRPLRMGESTGRLVLQSSDLASFYYILNLKATTSKPEKSLHFCTTLGSTHTITTKIMNYARQKTDYLLQTDCADFQTDKTISVPSASPGGSEVSVEVTYVPCQLGEARATLQLSSPLGGEYSIPLIGLALPPKPQGPFLIRPGSTISIPFTNIFPQAVALRCTLGHPAFTVKAPDTVRAKKTATITVSFKGGGPVCTKMVVSCLGGAGVPWVYYLRGLSSAKVP